MWHECLFALLKFPSFFIFIFYWKSCKYKLNYQNKVKLFVMIDSQIPETQCDKMLCRSVKVKVPFSVKSKWEWETFLLTWNIKVKLNSSFDTIKIPYCIQICKTCTYRLKSIHLLGKAIIQQHIKDKGKARKIPPTHSLHAHLLTWGETYHMWTSPHVKEECVMSVLLVFL